MRKFAVQFLHLAFIDVEDDAVMAEFRYGVVLGHVDDVLVHQNQASSFDEVGAVIKKELALSFNQIEYLILIMKMFHAHIKIPLADHPLQGDTIGFGIINYSFHIMFLSFICGSSIISDEERKIYEICQEKKDEIG